MPPRPEGASQTDELVEEPTIVHRCQTPSHTKEGILPTNHPDPRTQRWLQTTYFITGANDDTSGTLVGERVSTDN